MPNKYLDIKTKWVLRTVLYVITGDPSTLDNSKLTDTGNLRKLAYGVESSDDSIA